MRAAIAGINQTERVYSRATGTAWFKGQPVYISAVNTVSLADADDAAKAGVVGLLRDDVSSSATTCVIVLDGRVAQTSWTSVIGVATLTQGAVYYAATTPGMLTSVTPTGLSAQVRRVGVATSQYELLVDCDRFDAKNLRSMPGFLYETVDGNERTYLAGVASGMGLSFPFPWTIIRTVFHGYANGACTAVIKAHKKLSGSSSEITGLRITLTPGAAGWVSGQAVTPTDFAADSEWLGFTTQITSGAATIGSSSLTFDYVLR